MSRVKVREKDLKRYYNQLSNVGDWEFLGDDIYYIIKFKIYEGMDRKSSQEILRVLTYNIIREDIEKGRYIGSKGKEYKEGFQRSLDNAVNRRWYNKKSNNYRQDINFIHRLTDEDFIKLIISQVGKEYDFRSKNLLKVTEGTDLESDNGYSYSIWLRWQWESINNDIGDSIYLLYRLIGNKAYDELKDLIYRIEELNGKISKRIKEDKNSIEEGLSTVNGLKRKLHKIGEGIEVTVNGEKLHNQRVPLEIKGERVCVRNNK